LKILENFQKEKKTEKLVKLTLQNQKYPVFFFFFWVEKRNFLSQQIAGHKFTISFSLSLSLSSLGCEIFTIW